MAIIKLRRSVTKRSGGSKPEPKVVRPKRTGARPKLVVGADVGTVLKTLGPRLTVAIEPVENDKGVYLPLAPGAAGGQHLVKLVLRLRMVNAGSTTLNVNAIRFSFPGSSVEAVDMQFVDVKVDPGDDAYWSNGVVKLPDDSKISNTVFAPVNSLSKVTVTIRCAGFAQPITKTLNLAPHVSPVPGGAYLFPYAARDMRVGEYAVTSGKHWANGGAMGPQIFAHDISVQGVDPESHEWTSLLPGKDKSKNAHYRIYGKPVRAVADGTVESWLDTMNENTILGSFPDPTPDPTAGNHIWVKHGDEAVVYCHFQKGSIPAALKVQGAIVKAGQKLGLAGNSGNSTNPHTHIQAQQTNKHGPLRPMPFRAAWVLEREKFQPPNPSGAWTKLAQQGISKDAVAIWCADSAPAWYPPQWAEISHHGIAAGNYQTIFERVTSSGYKLAWLDGYEVDGKTFFNAIFRPLDGIGWSARHGLTGAQYQAEFDKQKKAGMRLVNLTSYQENGSIRYGALFEKRSGPAWKAYHGLGADDHQARFESWKAQGYRPVNVSVVSSMGVRSYAAFYEKKDVGAFELRSFLTPTEYQALWNSSAKAGKVLAYLSAYQHMGAPRLCAIFQKKTVGTGATVGRHGLSGAQYQNEYETQLAAGRLTRIVAGYAQGGSARFAGAWRAN